MTDNHMNIHMNIGEAIEALHNGERIVREGWAKPPHGPSFLYFVKGSVFGVNRAPLTEHFPEGTQIQYRAHIDAMRIGPNGSLIASYYDFTQDDILARDWFVWVDKEAQPHLKF